MRNVRVVLSIRSAHLTFLQLYVFGQPTEQVVTDHHPSSGLRLKTQKKKEFTVNTDVPDIHSSTLLPTSQYFNEEIVREICRRNVEWMISLEII